MAKGLPTARRRHPAAAGLTQQVADLRYGCGSNGEKSSFVISSLAIGSVLERVFGDFLFGNGQRFCILAIAGSSLLVKDGQGEC